MTIHARVARALALGALALSCATPAPRPNARLAVEVLAGLPRVPAWDQASPPHVDLLVDVRPASQRRVGGVPAIDVVRASASQLLDALPPDTRVTLHALGAGRGASCQDASALAEPVDGGPDDLVSAVSRAAPRTRASLAAGLRRVAETLALERRGPGSRVVAISDLAPECGGDPCEAARALVETGASLSLVVIGDAPAPACIAALALPEDPPAPLASVVPLTAPRFRAASARAGGGAAGVVEGVAGGDAIELAPGVARVEVDLDPPLVVPELALAPGALHRLRILDFPSASPPVREWVLETAEMASLEAIEATAPEAPPPAEATAPEASLPAEATAPEAPLPGEATAPEASPPEDASAPEAPPAAEAGALEAAPAPEEGAPEATPAGDTPP